MCVRACEKVCKTERRADNTITDQKHYVESEAGLPGRWSRGVWRGGVGGFIRGLLPLVFDLYDMASSFCVVLMLYKTLMNSYETLMISSLNSV